MTSLIGIHEIYLYKMRLIGTRLISEKLDGIRAYWDGQKLISRQMNEIKVMKELMEILPSVPLDGELWMGRQSLEHFNALLHSEYESQDRKLSWAKVGFHIYDLPFSGASYAVRLLQLNQFGLPFWCHIVDNVICSGTSHLVQLLQTLEKSGGEGLVARCANSPYISGRANCMQKVKVKKGIKLALSLYAILNAERDLKTRKCCFLRCFQLAYTVNSTEITLLL